MAEKGEMKSWEFLLQKEGDRTWLPLENPTVEILEGRYRVVARTPCAQEEVDIYVSFVSSEDDPPKRRIQQRSHAANDDGLLAILPFTPFRPGRWELRCRPHGAAGDAAPSWQSQIELQVLPQESPGDDDLFGWDRPQDDALDSQVTATDAPSPVDDIEPSVAPSVVEPSPVGSTAGETLSAADLDPATASEADIQRLAAEMSQMVVESSSTEPGIAAEAATPSVERLAGEAEVVTAPNLPSPGFTAADGLGQDAGTAVELSGAEELEEPGIAIALEEDVVMMDGDRRVTVRGQIVLPTPSVSPGDGLVPSELLLTVELRDPSTTEIWASHRESFRQVMAPAAFACQLQLPIACRTQLFLGNAILWQVEDNGHLERLVSQDFNVMAAVDDLLDHARRSDSGAATGSLDEGAVSNLQQQAASNFLVTKFGAKPSISKGNVQINTELLNLLKPTARAAGGQTGSAPATSRPAAAQPVGSSRIELPSFANARPVALPLADSLADDLAQDFNPNSDGELTLGAASLAGESLETESVTSAEGLETSLGEDLIAEPGEDNPFALPLEGDLDGLETFAAADGASVTAADGAMDSPTIPLTDALTNELGQASAFEPELPGVSQWTDDAVEQATVEQSSLVTGDAEAAGGLSLSNESAMALADGGRSLDNSAGLAHEVVVDDEETILPAKLAWMQPSPSEQLIDQDILVPVPELTVPEVELVKGETVRIQVRVAQEPARLCARVWLLDCQSRTLLGEPKWITAFLPLGDDLMEANVDLVIPEGSIELQVEAIAVEPITQRESRKISTRRKVSLGGEGQDLENW